MFGQWPEMAPHTCCAATRPLPYLPPFAAAFCRCVIFVLFFPRGGLFHSPFPLPLLFLSFLQLTGPSFAVVRGVEAITLRAITFEGPAAYVSTNKEGFLALVSPSSSSSSCSSSSRGREGCCIFAVIVDDVLMKKTTMKLSTRSRRTSQRRVRSPPGRGYREAHENGDSSGHATLPFDFLREGSSLFSFVRFHPHEAHKSQTTLSLKQR